MVVNEAHYDPQQTSNQLIEGMIQRCEELSKYINDAEYEKEDVESVILHAEFIDFDLRDRVIDGYQTKIENAQIELEDIRENLINKGYDYEP